MAGSAEHAQLWQAKLNEFERDEQKIEEIIDFGVKTIENLWNHAKCLLRFLRDYWELPHKLDIWDY